MNQMSSNQVSFCVKERRFIQNDFESQKFKPMGSILSFQDGHGSYMASIDLRDAYYSIPVHVSHKKCLKFMGKAHFISLHAYL